MKFNQKEIKKVEQTQDAILLSRLQKEHQYKYVKAKKKISDKIFYVNISLTNGRIVPAAFIHNSDLLLLDTDERFRSEPKIKRKVRGRPFNFCAGCVYEKNCSPEIECSERDIRRKPVPTIQDDRFWKNGVPRKRLVLCQSSKYMYAHKKTAGQCQEEKCSFYVNGKCDLGLHPNC